MKRRELIRTLERQGAVFIRHGGKHDWYQHPVTQACRPVPRHTEIKEYLARAIIRALSGGPPKD